MNEIINFIFAGTITDFDKVLAICFFFIIFEGVMNIVNMLTSMANGGKR